MTDNTEAEKAVMWVLSYSDGQHTLLDIAERAGLTFSAMRNAS